MKKLIDLIFKPFWVVVGASSVVAVLDLIGLTKTGLGLNTNEVGLGFIATFLYFIGGLIYKGAAKTKVVYPTKPKNLKR